MWLVLFLGLGLGLALAAGTPAHATRSPRTDPAFAGFRRGGISEVYVDRGRSIVAKLIPAKALAREQWINYPRWLQVSKGRIGAAARKLLTEQTLHAYARLRDDPTFARRYGHLLPRTWSPRAGRIDQTFVRGRAWDGLSPGARMQAGAEGRQVLALAARVLRGEQLDYNRYNFVFDREGHIKAWVDWVYAAVPLAVARAR